MCSWLLALLFSHTPSPKQTAPFLAPGCTATHHAKHNIHSRSRAFRFIIRAWVRQHPRNVILPTYAFTASTSSSATRIAAFAFSLTSLALTWPLTHGYNPVSAGLGWRLRMAPQSLR